MCDLHSGSATQLLVRPAKTCQFSLDLKLPPQTFATKPMKNKSLSLFFTDNSNLVYSTSIRKKKSLDIFVGLSQSGKDGWEFFSLRQLGPSLFQIDCNGPHLIVNLWHLNLDELYCVQYILIQTFYMKHPVVDI